MPEPDSQGGATTGASGAATSGAEHDAGQPQPNFTDVKESDLVLRPDEQSNRQLQKLEHSVYADVPDSPDGYRLGSAPPGTGPLNAELMAEGRQLMHDMQLPQQVATAIHQAHFRHAEPMSTDEVTEAWDATTVKLRKVWGDNFDTMLGHAASVVEALPADQRERVRQFFRITGAGTDPAVLLQLGALGEYRARQQKRG